MRASARIAAAIAALLVGSITVAFGGVPVFPATGGGGSSGVSSLNGQTGVVTTPLVEANVAALAAQASAGLSDGAEAYVVTLKAMFVLQASTTTPVALVNVAASGKTGYQWIRQLVRNPVWEVVTAWTVDPTNTTGVASDECIGTSPACPLLTYQEHSRRLEYAVIGQSVSVSVLGNQQTGDAPTYTYVTRAGNVVTFTGTPTVIYSSTVTSYTAMAVGTASADDCELADSSVPGGSFTAAGGLAKGVIYKRTNGTALYWYGLKDLGSTTLRCSQPMNMAAPTSQPVLVAADTYQALQLTQVLSIRFGYDTGPVGTQFTLFEWKDGSFQYGQRPQYTLTYVSANSASVGGIFQNCCMDIPGGSSAFFATGTPASGVGTFLGGGFKGTGASKYSISEGAWNMEGQIVCFQGSKVLTESGILNLQQVAVYDGTSSTGFLNSGTGGRIHLTGVISGKGNTNALVNANNGSQIVWTLPTIINASSTSSGTPYQAGATTSASPIALDSHMNGVFQTQ